MEVRQLQVSLARQTTVLNGNNGQIGNLTSLVVPAAAILGVLGYGYITYTWWRRRQRKMTKARENRSEALAVANRHFAQGIADLLDKHIEISKLIKNRIAELGKSLSDSRHELNDLLRQIVELEKSLSEAEHDSNHELQSLLEALTLRRTLAESDRGGRRAEALVCAICIDMVNVGETATKLPCGHEYHSDCIGPWLGLRNSCPVCRFKLPYRVWLQIIRVWLDL